MGCIDTNSFKYPKLLKEIPDPPKQLYYKGNMCPEIFENCLAIVGSRRMSLYGKRVVRHILKELSSEITVVSGFMTGVDATAHQVALEEGLRTIAVMPCGIDYIHPEHQVSLYNKILENNGLVLSEYAGDQKPQIWSYPKRNRIVAGISKATLVIEAAKKSGSLITAKLAHKFERSVYAVPGSIFGKNQQGIVQLLSTYAKPIIKGSEINDSYMLSLKLMSVDIKSAKNPILVLISETPRTINELTQLLKISSSEVASRLTYLQLDGLVTQEGELFYAS